MASLTGTVLGLEYTEHQKNAQVLVPQTTGGTTTASQACERSQQTRITHQEALEKDYPLTLTSRLGTGVRHHLTILT